MSGVSSMYVASSASIADGAVTEAKLAAEACSAAKMKKEGNAGEVLTSNGAGSIPSYQAAGAGSSSFVLIEDKTLAGAAASVDFTSYAAGYKRFFLTYHVKANGSTNDLGLRINGDTTNNNYQGQSGFGDSVTWGVGPTGGTYFPISNHNLGDNAYWAGKIEINNETPPTGGGHNLDMVGADWNGTNIGRDYQNRGFWKNDADITTITLLTSAGGFRIGSRLTLWGLK